MANDANHILVDRFSIVHAAVGALAELSRIPAPVAIGAQVAFELVEDDVKRRVSHVWPDPRPDGIENHVGDVLSFTAGFYAARAVRGSPTGGLALVLLAALAAGIWTQSLLPAGQPRLLR